MSDVFDPPDLARIAGEVVDGVNETPLSWPATDPWLPALCWQILAMHQQPKTWRSQQITQEHFARTALDLFPRRAALTAVELRSLERLLDVVLMDGQTSVEALYLCTFAACGLHVLLPNLADAAWDQLVRAGWSVDGQRITPVARQVRADLPVWRRDLLDVIHDRMKHERQERQEPHPATRAMAEAVVSAWAKTRWRQFDANTDWIDTPQTLLTLPAAPQAERATAAVRTLIRLLLIRLEDRDLVCRQALHWAASEAGAAHLPVALQKLAAANLDSRLWHRSHAEWRQLADRHGAEALLATLRALFVGAHLTEARDAAEALLAGHLRAMGLEARTGWLDAWWNRTPSAQRNDAVTKLAEHVPPPAEEGPHTPPLLDDPVVQSLLGSLVRAYIELDDVRPHAKALMSAVRAHKRHLRQRIPSLVMFEPGLDSYVERVEANQQARERDLIALRQRLDQLEASEDATEATSLQSNTTYIQEMIDDARRAPATPKAIEDAESGWIALALKSGLDWIISTASDSVDELLAEGALLRERGDVVALRQRADSLATREAFWAGGVAGASTLASNVALPAAVVGSTLDIAMVLSMAVRVCALQAALFGHDPRTQEGQIFVLATLTSAVSGSSAQGALPWLLKSGGIAELLAAHSSRQAVFSRFVPLISAHLGSQITTRTLVAVVPVISAALHSALSYRLVARARTHAIELGTFEARDARGGLRPSETAP